MNLTQLSDPERTNALIITTWAFQADSEMRFPFLL
jgi:hypothetical protein